MKQTQSAGGVVLNEKNQVLVVSQFGTSWSLPKGHVEQGEDLRDAAVREITEESGVSDLEFIKELGSYSRYRIGKDPRFEDETELKTITLFLFRTKHTGSLSPIDPHNPEARWVEKDEVSELLTNKKDREFYERILSELK